jgi:flavorubredoxin
MANKPYVVFGSKGGGGAQALESVEKICDGLKMTRVAQSLAVTRKPDAQALADCKELGKKLAHPERLETPKGVDEPRL